MINETQLVGLFVFGIAAASCFLRNKGEWKILGLVFSAFMAEIILGWRHMTHKVLVGWLGSFYNARAPIQLLMLIACVICIAALAVTCLRQTHKPLTVRLVYLLALLALGLFGVEAISLHKIDALLYQPVGPVLYIAWIWGAICLGVTSIAIGDSIHKRLF